MNVLDFRNSRDHARAAPSVVRHLHAGGLIAYPTETVYGFGCALLPPALRALALLKQRQDDKPFLLLVLDRAQVPGLAWTPAADALARAFWPGPLTLVLRNERGEYPARVVAEGAVALRATPHAGVRAVLEALGGPITSTSANLPGRPPATDGGAARAVLAALPASADVLLLDAGALPPSPPSTIVDCTGGNARITRAGAILVEQLRTVVKEIDV